MEKLLKLILIVVSVILGLTISHVFDDYKVAELKKQNAELIDLVITMQNGEI